MILALLLLFTQTATSLSQQGAAAMRAGKFAEAQTAYRALIQQDPQNPMWRMNLGIALHSAGDYVGAVPEFQRYLKSQPAPGPVHLLLGLAQLKRKQPCAAIEPLEAAVKWDWKRSALELADAYYGCKRYKSAARAYEKAGALRKDAAKITRQAAHCYWQARLYEDAQRLFGPLAKAYADDPEFGYEYGDTLARTVGPEAALPWLERAVQANPALLSAQGELGKALLELGRAADSVAHLEAAAPTDSALLLPLSRAYQKLGRTEDSERTRAEYRKKASGGSN